MLLISGCTPKTSSSELLGSNEQSTPDSSSGSESSSDEITDTPIAKKIKISLASTVATDRGDVQIQNNNKVEEIGIIVPTEQYNPYRLDSISGKEVSYTILESTATSFDIAISGLQDGEFGIEIKKLLVNEGEPSDVTNDFFWLFFLTGKDPGKTGGREVGIKTYSLNPNHKGPEEYKSLTWGENSDGETYDVKRKTLYDKVLDEDVEYRIYRIKSLDTFELNVSELQVRVYQDIQVEVDEHEISGLRVFSPERAVETQTIEGFMVVNTFDFEVEYDKVADADYTDLNNLKVKINSESYDVEYKSEDGEFKKDVFVELTIEDHEMIPYEPIDIRYKEKSEEDGEEWTYVQDFLVVFPHVGNVNKETLQFKESLPSGAQLKFALGGSTLSVVYGNYKYTTMLRAFDNFKWTGLKLTSANFQLVIGETRSNSVNISTHIDIDFPNFSWEETFGVSSELIIGNVVFNLGQYTRGEITNYFGFDQRIHYFSGSNQIIFK